MPTQTPKILPKYLHEEEVIAQEYKDLIFSLPKENGWVNSHLYKYQGFYHPVRHVQGIITCQQHYKPRNSDVILITTPKSGTTWLKALVFSVINRIKHPITKDDHPLLTKNPHDLVPFLEHRIYVDNQIPNAELSSMKSPRIFSTHIPFSSLPESVLDSGCKLVYLCRNPKDTFVSLWQFCNKLRTQEMGTHSLEETLDMFCRGVSIAGPFWDHVMGYWNESKKNPDKVLFLKYDEMKEHATENLRRIAEYLGCQFSDEEEESKMVEEILKLCSFDNLSNLEVNRNGKLSSGEENKAFFRQGKAGAWKNYLTVEMANKLDQITEQKFSGSGLVLK